MSKPPFVPVPSPFGVPGKHDEQATQDAFVEYVGGSRKADELERIWKNVHPMNAWCDECGGVRWFSHEEIFRIRAVKDGFDIEDANAFLALQ